MKEVRSFGLVARNSAGELCEAKALFQPGLTSPIEAEAMAFKEALSWMDRRGWYDVVIESDCLRMVVAHQLSRESYILSGRTFDWFNIPTSIQACIDLDLNS